MRLSVAAVFVACSSADDVGTTSSAVQKPPADGGEAAAPQVDGSSNIAPLTPSSTTGFVQIINGSQAFMVAGGDSSPWVVGFPSRNIFQYSNDLGGARTWNWVTNDNATRSIAVSPEGTPWKIDTSGNITRGTKNGASWVWNARGNIQGGGTLNAWEIGVGANEVAWAIAQGGNCLNSNSTADCPIYQWNDGTQLWAVNTVGWARHVTVTPDGTAWVANTSGELHYWAGSSWPQMAGCMRNASGVNGSPPDVLGEPVIAAADNTALWVLGCTSTNNIFVWQTEGAIWNNIPGTATSITVTADGTPWIVDSTNNHNISEYVSAWQSVGPYGFSMVDKHGVNQIYTGQVQDIDATPTTGRITIGATSGGVWQTPPTLGWVSIGDVGAGAGVLVGPVNAIGSVAVKPVISNNPIIVGTGVANQPNSPNTIPGSQFILDGNGIWIGTANADGRITWNPSTMFDANNQAYNQQNPGPNAIVKLRYSSDASKIYAVGAWQTQNPITKVITETSTALFLSLDDGVTFHQATDAACAPASGNVMTDLVVDPNNSNIAYVGVSGEGVYQANYINISGALACLHGSQPILFSGPTSSITNVALAISQSSVLYAAFAGNTLPFDPGDDFENIDATSTATWGQPWSIKVQADSVDINYYYGLNSQGGHNWAMGTNPGGDVILLGGQALHRWDSCNQNQCANHQLLCEPDNKRLGVPYPTADCPNHHDYHSIVWGGNGWVYVANDGGLFLSEDNGITWYNQINSFGVTNGDSVAVSGTRIFATAWDVGGHYSLDDGTTWLSDPSLSPNDGVQAAADLNVGSNHGFICHDNQRFMWDGSSWAPIDTGLQEANNCLMAKGKWGDLFTVGLATSGSFNHVFHSSNYGVTWSQYQGNVPPSPPSDIVVSNELTPTVYAFSGTKDIAVSVGGQQWTWVNSFSSPWPVGDGFNFAGTAAARAASTDWLTSDFYVAVADSSFQNAQVWKSPVTSHGTSWTPLAGTTPAVPGMLKPDEYVESVAVDSSARAVIVGTDGTKPPPPTSIYAAYGPASVWRLNNPDAPDVSHHWRPWVNGLPFGTLPVAQVTGQYENGVFYFYITTWGRGVWKREARGGDL